MSILSRDHYTAFGIITHFYASVEFGIKGIIAGILETPFIEALILSEPYSASSLKNVAKSLAKESKLSVEEQQTFIQIVGDWSAFSALRNFIAHNRWQKGERPNAARPVGVDIRSGKVKWIVTEESRDWLASELFEEAKKLADIDDRLRKFYNESGLSEIIARKDAERNASIAE